jgi:glycosyltransferase involved in cell wall biosynthesis
VAKQRPDAHFLVCGAGPFYDEMAAYAVKEGFADRMHLPGVQSGIGKWFAAMDAVLLTSRHEGLPNVLIEAQSLGVPVVVPRVGGAGEVLVDGETGFAIPKATAAMMAKKLVFILEYEAWREAAHAASAAFIAGRFSMERMVDATLDVYFPEGLPEPKAKATSKRKAASKPKAAPKSSAGKPARKRS